MNGAFLAQRLFRERVVDPVIGWVGDAIAAGIAAAYGAPVDAAPAEPVGDPEPPDPFRVFAWGYDPDVFADVCRLQAEWLALRGSGDPARLRVMRAYHQRVGVMYPHAA